MEIIWTRTKTIVTVSVLLLVVAVLVVKKICFPTVDEKFFLLDSDRLQKAPANVLVLRPTEFPESRRAGAFTMPTRTKSGQYDPQHMRMVGRNVPLSEVIAQAYQCQPSRIVMPTTGEPTNHFDFLVTVRNKPAERLQQAIKKKLGYTGSWKEREAEVLQIKVLTPNAPGLRVSSTDNRNINFKNGRLYFTHFPVGQLTGMLENVLKMPVQDQTGLTGFYDFSIPWNGREQNSMDEATVRKTIGELGLTLKSDSETMRMMVVESVK